MLEDSFSQAVSGVDTVQGYSSGSFSNIGVSTHGSALDWNFTDIDLLYISQVRGGTQGDSINVSNNGSITVYGYEGDDTLTGGTGSQTFYGGDGVDTIYGGDNSDTIYGGDGVDNLFGGEGTDYFYTNDDDDADNVDGGEGGDWYYVYSNDVGETYVDTGTTGTDTIYYASSSGTFNIADNFNGATAGIDRIHGYSSGSFSNLGYSSHTTARNWDLTGVNLLYISEIRGGTQGDIITIDDTDGHTIRGYGGDDTITADGGSQVIYGGDGTDTIYGGDGSDNIYGGDGVDNLFGGEGTDYFYANDDDDADNVDGGEGGDWYYVYSNNVGETYVDTGTTGTDTIYYASSSGNFNIADNFNGATAGIDRIHGYSSGSFSNLGYSSTRRLATGI